MKAPQEHGNNSLDDWNVTGRLDAVSLETHDVVSLENTTQSSVDSRPMQAANLSSQLLSIEDAINALREREIPSSPLSNTVG